MTQKSFDLALLVPNTDPTVGQGLKVAVGGDDFVTEFGDVAGEKQEYATEAEIIAATLTTSVVSPKELAAASTTNWMPAQGSAEGRYVRIGPEGLIRTELLPPTAAPAIGKFDDQTDYKLNDLVTFEGKVYRAPVDIPAASFTPANWENIVPLPPADVLTTFDPLKTYAVYDLVAYNGRVYSAKAPVAAGAWDVTKWTDIGEQPVVDKASVYPFDATKAYVFNDLVSYQGRIYRCLTAVGPSSWSSTSWSEIGAPPPAASIYPFLQTKPYTAGDLVTYGGYIYRAKAFLNAGVWDVTKWEDIAAAYVDVDAITIFDPAKTYAADDLVTFRGKIYRAKTALAAGPWIAPNWEDILPVVTAGLEPFNANKMYLTNDLVSYQGKVYRAKGPLPTGAWDATKWEDININPDLKVSTSVTPLTGSAGIGAAYTALTTKPATNVILATYGGDTYLLTGTGTNAGTQNADWALVSSGTVFATQAEVDAGTDPVKPLTSATLRGTTLSAPTGGNAAAVGDANKLPRLDAKGQLNYAFVPASSAADVLTGTAWNSFLTPMGLESRVIYTPGTDPTKDIRKLPALDATGKIPSAFIPAAGTVDTGLTAARTYYVSTTGSDNNDGLTVGAPFKTIQKAIDVAAALNNPKAFGITIQIADGVYAEALSVVNSGATTLGLKGNTATPSAVVIAPTGAGAAGRPLQVIGSSVTIDGLHFSTTSNHAVYASNHAKVVVTGACELTFKTGFSAFAVNEGSALFIGKTIRIMSSSGVGAAITVDAHSTVRVLSQIIIDAGLTFASLFDGKVCSAIDILSAGSISGTYTGAPFKLASGSSINVANKTEAQLGGSLPGVIEGSAQSVFSPATTANVNIHADEGTY